MFEYERRYDIIIYYEVSLYKGTHWKILLCTFYRSLTLLSLADVSVASSGIMILPLVHYKRMETLEIKVKEKEKVRKKKKKKKMEKNGKEI